VELPSGSWIKTVEEACFCTGCVLKPWMLSVYMGSRGDWTSKNPLQVARCTTAASVSGNPQAANGWMPGERLGKWHVHLHPHHRPSATVDHCQKLVTRLERPLVWTRMMLPIITTIHCSCRIMPFLFFPGLHVYFNGVTCKY